MGWVPHPVMGGQGYSWDPLRLPYPLHLVTTICFLWRPPFVGRTSR